MGIETVSLIIAGFVNASLGVAALMRNFRSRLCMAFAFLCFCLFLHDVLSVLENFDTAMGWVSPTWHLFFTLLIGPAIFWLLRELPPREKRREKRKAFFFLVLASSIAATFLLQEGARLTSLLMIAAHSLLVYPAWVWLRALHGGRGGAELTREKLRLRYLFFGGVFTLALFITDALHFYGFPVPPLGTLGRVLYLMFVFQTVVQKELMTSEEVVAKIAHFGGIAWMLSIVYWGLVSWVGDRTDLFLFNTFLASFVIIVLFEPIRKAATRFTRRLFLRRNSHLEDDLNKLSHDLMGELEPPQMGRRLFMTLRKTISLQKLALYLPERDGLSLVCAYESDGARFPEEVAVSSPLVEYMALRRGRPFLMDTVENDRDSFHSVNPRRFCEDCVGEMRRLGADMVLPFFDEAKLLGFCAIATGERSPLSNEQLRLFIPITRQLAMLLGSAQAFNLLRRRERLAIVGEMAAGLAHEIKNPLGAIKGAAQLLKESGVPANPSLQSQEFLKIIVEEANRLSGVLSDFLDYAKPRSHHVQAQCDPMRVIEHTVALLSQEKGVIVDIESESEGVTVEADPDTLKQILLNLLLNAVDSMEDEAARRIHVLLRERKPKRSFALPDSLPLYKIWEGWEATEKPAQRGVIEISVSDNGVGITDEDLPNIFTPFFTTKRKGTGLGLAICQRLIESMGGSITVRSNQPKGSIFTIHLPVGREEPGGRDGRPRRSEESRV